ncbi:MAG: hypothetical protein IKT98_01755 [Selenomonadaceae bacterium]|nr:hypothetical protein [Selenomonadaceae bacterium]
MNKTPNEVVVGTGWGDGSITNYAGGTTILGSDFSDFIVSSTYKEYTIKGSYGYVTIEGGAGNDTIFSHDDYVSIKGEAGNDSICAIPKIDEDSFIGIDGGTGDDTIALTSGNGGGRLAHFYYNEGDGNDYIQNWASNYVIYIHGSSPYTSITVDNDVILGIGDGNITLEGAGGLEHIYAYMFGKKIDNAENNVSIVGTSLADTISNSGASVTIDGGDDYDYIYSYRPNVSISGGAGNDNIYNKTSYLSSKTETVTETVQVEEPVYEMQTFQEEYYEDEYEVIAIPHEKIERYEVRPGDWRTRTVVDYYTYETVHSGFSDTPSYRTVTKQVQVGTKMVDSIVTSTKEVPVTIQTDNTNSTINGGEGDDRIFNEAENFLYEYALGDGNDTITGFNENSTLKITGGEYSAQSSGTDVLVKVGEGTLTLKDLLKTTDKLNINNKVISLDKVLTLTDGDDSIENLINSFTINGGKGNDTIKNKASNVTIDGGAGKDYIKNEGDSVTITGGNSDNYIYNYSDDYIENYGDSVTIDGGSGNDYIYNYGDSATIDGGTGNDSIRNYGSSVKIDGGTGNDYIRSSSYYDGGNNVTIDGGTGNDSIYSNGNNVSINAGVGDDSIYNSGDSATIDGGDGNDTIHNYGDSVTVDGGAGNDSIYNNWHFNNNAPSANNYGSNVLFKYALGGGNDVIYGFKENSTLSISGGSYSTTKSGNDIIVTVGDGSVTLKDAANLSKINIDENDTANDVADDAAVDDTADDAIDDTADDAVDDTADDAIDDTEDDAIDDTADDAVDDTADDAIDDTADDAVDDTADDAIDDTADDTEDDAFDKDEIFTIDKKTSPSVILDEHKKIADASKHRRPIKIIGNAHSNKIIGGFGNDILDGAGGNNTLTGGKGKDIFIYSGGKGIITDYDKQDKISVGSDYKDFTVDGDDVIFNFSGKNSLKISGGAGKAVNMNSGVNYYTADGVIDKKKKSIVLNSATKKFTADSKLMTIDGAATDSVNIVGNNKKNKIIAGTGGATLNGGRGNDTLTGGDGADIFIYEKGKDVIDGYSAGDVISLGKGATIKDAKIKKGNAVFKVKGGSITVNGTTDITLTADGKTTHFNNGVFIDDDSVRVLGSFKDTIDLANYEVTTADASLAKKKLTINGTNSADSIVGGNSKDKLYGNEGDDFLIGGKGNDTLDGGAGVDSLWGGKGNDFLNGGEGADNFIFYAGDGNDTIQNYNFAEGDMLQILDKKGKESTFSKAKFNGSKLTLSIKGGGKVIFSGVNTSTNFNINGKTYTF